MFGSAILDLAIGLVFTFLAVSLAASAITEMVASATKWRAVTLRKGIQDLLNDPKLVGLGQQIYQHALINPRADGTALSAKSWSKLPAYIDPQSFGHAMTEVLGIADAAMTPAAINTKIAAVADPQLRNLLQGIADRTAGNVGKMSDEVAHWFDTAMDRVSGVYKRGAQLFSFLIALALAAMLNVSAIHVTERLWRQPIDTATIAQIKAEDIAKNGPGEILKKLEDMDALSGTVGWRDANSFRTFWQNELWHPKFDTVSRIVGWLITAGATMFGAAFWFDALQQIIRLKGSGPSPQEKREGKGAAA
ncbi:MAG: hypothetical protein JO230_25230 [Xanthobacteraceae bacterium]|nr:hypothetical protein [Xanthobacteraceae bacterium]